MKIPSKPSFDSVGKLSSTGARPAFPVQLNPDKGNPFAAKTVAAAARATGAAGQNDLKRAFLPGASSGLGLDSAVRARMVRRLAEQGVLDAQVLAAMGAVHRHHFVDTALANMAYEDTSLPIGFGQTISKPNVVARMLELLQQGLHDASGRLGRVLEIGTGCGYQAAVLSHLATEVYSMERLRGLHDKARENLRSLRLANVHLLFGDGMNGFTKGAPYAGIIAAAGGEAIPLAWTEQLAMGGRLVAPLQDASGAQALVVIDKTPQGIRQTLLEAVHFVPLKSGVG
ncbi:protein-L-isoaspartate(D-aspartate) O-methyltransferase [Polaromonas sp. DSR2-3-2]|uniref:protein-L-isoaspartate(D-aspartate) O-methyltransferase n=1 Tax=unclassified Polaromonas TaxID=2638319 RepID=UPI003CF7B2AA